AIPPMPVWSVAPSGTNATACAAIARSISEGAVSGSATGSRSEWIRTSMSWVWIAWGCAGGSPSVRGRRGVASTISTRAGARPQLVDRRARVERERAEAVAVGRRGRRRHHARRHAPGYAREAAEVGRHEAHRVTRVAQRALDRPVEARLQCYAGPREQRERV